MDFDLMDLTVTTDMELVRAIMTEPDIWERAAEDGVDIETWYPGYDGMTAWMLCIEDESIVGVILLHTDTSVSIKMHPYLRQEHRSKGRDMMKAFYEWFLHDAQSKINKINVTIPINQRKVINFSLKVGFKKEGICRQSHLKGGVLHDIQHLGITRKEVEGYLDAIKDKQAA
eukprot:GHVU01006637.1.p3 GENE.GHVU01006637.1~~GHVU01006637.1.p3  ORF type:complete len:172 (+),score=16.68 GHVU01006637.1:1099-1614(+)